MGESGQVLYNSYLHKITGGNVGIRDFKRIVEMKKAVSVYRGWRKKRDFIHLVLTKESRLLKDVGYPPEIIEQRLRTPFWKFV
jgi:uncharacterized protein YjiS (DUF1127 family)